MSRGRLVANSKGTPNQALQQTGAQTIDWYSQGQSLSVVIDGQEIVVRFAGRRGRRARICVTAPAGAVFVEHDSRWRPVEATPGQPADDA